MSGRARLSVPSLLARADEQSVMSVMTAINGGLSILVIGFCAWLVDLPLVIPVLGPTAFILYNQPFSPAGAPRSVLVGHTCGLLVGLSSWRVVSFVCGEPITLGCADWPEFVSASLALAVLCVLLVRLSCPHAPACATAIVVALGGVPDWRGFFAILLGIVILTAQAVCLNRLFGVRTPIWRMRGNQSATKSFDEFQ